MKRISIILLLLGLAVAIPTVTHAAPPQRGNQRTTAAKGNQKKGNPSNQKKAAQSNQKKTSSQPDYARNELDLHQLHHVAIWGGAGYSGMVNNYAGSSEVGMSAATKFIGGGGGLFGVGYEWHYKRFMLSLGPEFRFFSSQDNIMADPLTISLSDYTPKPTKFYDFQHFHETQMVGQFMVPIMAGMQFDNLSIPLYFMAGFKLGAAFLGNYSQKATLVTSVRDIAAMDDWYNVPSHDLTTTKYTASGKNKFGFDAAISLEVGANLDSYMPTEWAAKNDEAQYPWHFRVALFLDYGFPIHSLAQNSPMIEVDETTAYTQSIHTSSYAMTSNAKGEQVGQKFNSLLVGAKFTAYLQLNRPKQLPPDKPYIVVQLIDAKTRQPIDGTGSKLEIKNLANNRIAKKSPNKKGFLAQKYALGSYELSVEKEGYLPVEPQQVELVSGKNISLKEKLDTTFFLLKPEPIFSCRVRDAKTGEFMNAHVNVFDTVDNKLFTRLSFAASEGSVTTKLPVNRFYNLYVEANGYKPKLMFIGEQGEEDMAAEVLMDPVEKKTYIIRNLFFASDATEVLPKSEKALQELYNFLNENPTVRVRITGHTDWVGSDEDNQILSEGRAKSVRQSMIDRGIDGDRIETEGKGETEPIATNETEAGRQSNRRVEMTILEGAEDDTVTNIQGSFEATTEETVSSEDEAHSSDSATPAQGATMSDNAVD